MADTYDVIIIGSGPGGYVAAIRAAQLGLKTAIVEREHLGGICSNWGCIPTKALLRSAEIYHYAEHAKDYGLTIEGKIDCRPRRRRRSARAASPRSMNDGVGFLMKKNKVDVIWGEAKLTKPGEIVVAKTAKKPMEPQAPVPKNTLGEGTYTAKHIIVATGARPRALPGIEPDGKLIWTYFEAMVPAEMPKSLLVMGSGAIGIEFASLLPHDGRRGDGGRDAAADHAGRGCRDRRASRSKQFEKQGMKILTRGQGRPRSRRPPTASPRMSRRRTARSRRSPPTGMISAVGVQGNIENLGLEALGVKTDRGIIVIDGYGQHQRRRHLCHRRRRRPADAGPQGRA